jgi:hypothetical protein
MVALTAPKSDRTIARAEQFAVRLNRITSSKELVEG